VPPPFVASPLRPPLVPTSPYGARGPVRLPDGTTKPEGFHPGLDLRAAVGTPCFAVGPGVVENVESGRAGLILRLRLDTGERVSYVHLLDVRAGLRQRVAAGQLVALTGESGGVAPHLHLEVRAAGASTGTDPTPYVRPFFSSTPPPSTPSTPGKKGGGGLLVAAALLWGFS
jgi:murein DD-endopeptidase MepM/ murein hydrolase activator NlpD